MSDLPLHLSVKAVTIVDFIYEDKRGKPSLRHYQKPMDPQTLQGPYNSTQSQTHHHMPLILTEPNNHSGTPVGDPPGNVSFSQLPLMLLLETRVSLQPSLFVWRQFWLPQSLTSQTIWVCCISRNFFIFRGLSTHSSLATAPLL